MSTHPLDIIRVFETLDEMVANESSIKSMVALMDMACDLYGYKPVKEMVGKSSVKLYKDLLSACHRSEEL